MHRDVVEVPSVVTFEIRLDEVLSNLFWLELPLFTARWLDKMPFEDPFQPTVLCEHLNQCY